MCLKNDGGHSRDPDLECVKHDNLLITGVFHSWLGSHLESFGICNQVLLSGRSGSVHKLRWPNFAHSCPSAYLPCVDTEEFLTFIREYRAYPSSCQRSLWMTPVFGPKPGRSKQRECLNSFHLICTRQDWHHSQKLYLEKKYKKKLRFHSRESIANNQNKWQMLSAHKRN